MAISWSPIKKLMNTFKTDNHWPTANNPTMIITFATQKGGAAKTTLPITFANYVCEVSQRKIKAYDFDFQKSFFNKWKEDEYTELPSRYEVEPIVDDEEEQPFADLEKRKS